MLLSHQSEKELNGPGWGAKTRADLRNSSISFSIPGVACKIAKIAN
jgi:hypothetical protein